MNNKTAFVSLFALGALMLAVSACGGGQPNAPAASPTVLTGAPPTATVSATPTPAPSPSGGNGVAVITALAKFQTALVFRLDARVQVSPLFFAGNYTPAPGEDPKQVTIFSIKGEEKTPDSHYAVGGLLGSIMALTTGFDLNSDSVELISVGGKKYARGTLPGASEAKWYVLSDEQANSTRFDPKKMLLPIVSANPQVSDLSKTGTENLDNHSCDLYSASRAAFDRAFPEMRDKSALKEDSIDLSVIDSFEFKFWVCDDGYLHQVRYAFSGHDKTQPDQKGAFTYVYHISDYNGAITIQAPPNVTPFDSGATTTQVTPTPVAQETAPAQAGYDGDWEGKSSTDSPILFTVQDNQITYVTLEYRSKPAGCPFSVTLGKPVQAPIQGNHFTVQIDDTSGTETTQYTFTGDLASNTQAAGTLQIKAKLDCGSGETQVTWTAKNTTAANIANPMPTVAAVATKSAPPTETPAPASDPSSVISSFFNAINSKNVDAAIALADDDVVFNIGSASGIGNANLKTYFAGQISRGVTYQLSNLKATGSTLVSFAAQTSDGTIFSQSSAILSDGKIQILTLR